MRANTSRAISMCAADMPPRPPPRRPRVRAVRRRAPAGGGDLDLAHHDVRGRLGPPAGRERVDQGAALVLVQVAREREPRDAAPAERADERLEVERAAAEGPAVDHDLVVQPEEGERVLAALVARRHHAVPELRERAGHRRVRGRVEGAGGERPGDLGDQPLDRRLP